MNDLAKALPLSYGVLHQGAEGWSRGSNFDFMREGLKLPRDTMGCEIKSEWREEKSHPDNNVRTPDLVILEARIYLWTFQL